MPIITAAEAGGQNVLAFLDMLAFAEGTSTSPYTFDDGYDVVVGGFDSPNTFNDYSEHPEHPDVLVTVNSHGLKSTAAGRYQLLYRYWCYYRKHMKLEGFGPLNQDRIAIQQIREQRAFAFIQSGHLSVAIARCSNIWASLPGNHYDQHQGSFSSLIRAYESAGGTRV
ncbi:glycoside hydrolase family 24 protein [Pseudomonas triticifolii]|uniref:Glycoside hydrolase family 104 protein n=1 Tax=Pseudomonas triticifolii TaxID=2762592 RepID=A0ABR7B987_9PSED|nr:glycoside hydrolase family 104 protein [Pseudomonas triticifolii]MBC3953734.1 glycoside hydrolase family 104 protein [Pseudomonas triticifolii]